MKQSQHQRFYSNVAQLKVIRKRIHFIKRKLREPYTSVYVPLRRRVVIPLGVIDPVIRRRAVLHGLIHIANQTYIYRVLPTWLLRLTARYSRRYFDNWKAALWEEVVVIWCSQKTLKERLLDLEGLCRLSTLRHFGFPW